MPNHTLYKILSYILLPVAAIFAIFSLMLLLVALANPPILLPLFVVVCVVIYIITSFNFFNKGILRGRPFKPRLKDLIKVNAFVSIVFCGMIFMNTMAFISQPQLVSEALDQTPMPAGAPAMPKETLIKAMKAMMYALGVIALLLFIHILTTFRLLRRYNHLFAPPVDTE